MVIVTRSIKRKAGLVIYQAVYDCFFQKDPISLERINVKFTLVRNHSKHVYDATNLFEYIISSGDFQDPITRIPYNSCELLRLEHMCEKPSFLLVQKKDELQTMRKNHYISMGLCDVFEIEMFEQISCIREKLYDLDFELKFRFEYIPTIIQCFENFKTVNMDRCYLAIQHILRKLNEMPLQILEIHLRLRSLLETLCHYCNPSMYESSAIS